jgi:hypothetical protein
MQTIQVLIDKSNQETEKSQFSFCELTQISSLFFTVRHFFGRSQQTTQPPNQKSKPKQVGQKFKTKIALFF